MCTHEALIHGAWVPCWILSRRPGARRVQVWVPSLAPKHYIRAGVALWRRAGQVRPLPETSPEVPAA